MQIEDEMQRLNIQQTPGMGIFCLDFSAFFPYANPDVLDLDASLSTEPMNAGSVLNLRDQGVLNHRYPNKGYVTLSQKFGRKFCKTGCIIQHRHEDLTAFKYINLTYAIGGIPVRISVPIDMTTSDDRPCVAVEIKFDLEDPDTPDISIRTYEKQPSGGWRSTIYGTKNPSQMYKFNYIPLTPANTVEARPGFIVYKERIKLVSQRSEDILL